MAKTTQTAVAERQADAPDAPRPDFFMFTDAMKAHEDSDRPTVLATASSTAVDLEADRFTAKALKQMKAGFVGKLIFLNHSYHVPQDVFGVVMKAELIKREGRLDLDMVIGVEMNNPLAVQTHQYILNGTRLGVSVGVIVTEAEKSDEEDQYGNTIFDIDGVIPLEASVVGIPANQTAWTRQAIKSLFARGALDLDDVEVEARPWLKTAVQVKEAAKAKAGESKQKETRLWVTTDDGEVVVEITDEQKEAIMAQRSNGDETPDETKSETDEERAVREAAAAEGSETKPDETKDDDPDDSDDPDEKKDEEPDEPEKKDEEPDEPEKKDEEPEKKDEPEAAPEKKDDDSDDPDEKKDDPESKKDDSKSDDPDETKDFDDEVAADEAVDVLIGKMYTGLYVALNNLIPILMDTDLSAGDRAKQGEEVIADWSAFVETTWSEITDNLNSDKDVKPDENFNLASSLHAHIAKQDEVSCDQHGIDAVTAKVKEISDAAEAMVDANAQLVTDNERQAKALKLAEGVIEVMMELPLQTVTTREQASAQSLAQHFPDMDTRVVERMARYAPPQDKE